MIVIPCPRQIRSLMLFSTQLDILPSQSLPLLLTIVSQTLKQTGKRWMIMKVAAMKRQAWGVLLTLNGEKEPTSLTLALDVASQFNTNCILHEAIELGTATHLLIQLATRFPILLSQIDGNGRYPLHIACQLPTRSI